jgi:hypothetical protein
VGAVVVVGKKIVRTKHVASIEDHAHSDDLKKRMILVFQNSAYTRNHHTRTENGKSRIKKKYAMKKRSLPFEITFVVVVLPPLLLPLIGVGR